MRADLESSLEQSWLCEAVTDCYLPLLCMMRKLKPRAAPWLTLSLSPTLLELWAHPQFKQRYRQHLQDGLIIIAAEAENKAAPAPRRRQAREIERHWQHSAEQFDLIDGNLAAAFAEEAQRGCIEIITTAATHAFLPGHQTNKAYRHFQIENGLRALELHTGIQPKGFWIPECGYFPGLEDDLNDYGIEYFALEDIGLTSANPTCSIRQPLKCPNGLRALGRDELLSRKVWNARIGYPGHPNYREFHQDAIYEISPERCGQFALPNGGRLPFGLKYWRVTGSPQKDWYDASVARKQAEADAENFVQALSTTEKGLTFLPFDAELFGHWWHEGPLWLEKVLLSADLPPDTTLNSANHALAAFSDPPCGRPAASTWGRSSDYSFWINNQTDWIYPLLRDASEALEACLRQVESSSASAINLKHQKLLQRTVAQAARELLLAGASDWPFMIRAGATVEYAQQRLRDHLGRCHYLLASLQNGTINQCDLELIEDLNPAFSNVSTKAFGQRL